MNVSILYVCNEDRGTSRQRLLALADLGVEHDIVFTCRLNDKIGLVKRIYRGVLFRAGFFPERNNENKLIREAVAGKKYQLLFVEKGLSVRPSTLRFVKKLQPAIKIISYTLDDVMNPHNSSWYYRWSVRLYDLHFTNKRYNVDELKQIGAKKVEYFRNAFSPHVHRPVATTGDDKRTYGADISFIGTFEKERAEVIREIAGRGYKVRIWGWASSAESTNMLHPNITIMDRHVYDDEYAKVICTSSINLCFLRKENRDTETTRSIEIPACGGFMLAERTTEHQQLFGEGKEADYFSDTDELIQKVKFYLDHAEIRMKIAAAGRQRCIKDDYSYNRQLESIITTALAQ
jgi:spore maturation protein CgeB